VIFSKFTGRTTPPTSPLHEAWLVCGRRGGKSFILATIAVFLAAAKQSFRLPVLQLQPSRRNSSGSLAKFAAMRRPRPRQQSENGPNVPVRAVTIYFPYC
jgi:hypothetical protein